MEYVRSERVRVMLDDYRIFQDYAFSLKNGVRIIVQDGKIIGRVVWARPACDCHVVEDSELEYPEWEMSDLNEFMYGGM